MQPVYPEAQIESWLNQSEAAFPAVKSTALYWDIKARLEERRGNTMEALDIYSQALENKTEVQYKQLGLIWAMARCIKFTPVCFSSP